VCILPEREITGDVQRASNWRVIQGEKIRGVSLSLTQTLKSHNNLDEFVFFLKDIIRKIHLEDGELEAEINQFIKRFCFILTFYNKFESVFKKLDFQ
jgi:hypothetical protein